MDRVIGVLALQGAFQKHIDMLRTLNVAARTVRQPHELAQCDALIIPGGESTTISLLVQEYDLYEPIRTFAEQHPVMGVCAGMIMMASEVDDARVTPLRLMPFTAVRNHYGRQVHSFSAEIRLNFADSGKLLQAHFIRAPGITALSADIEVLAAYDDEAVMIASGKHMALSFHPELTDDTRIHEYWLSKLSQDASVK
jgi:5'-phosphate synthase pdxT subunit